MKQLAPSRTSVARLKRLPPGFSAAGLALATLACPLAQATSWQVNDDWSLTTNTTLTLGNSWALRNADPDQLTIADARSIGKRGEGINYSADDGKLNFDKGDSISQVFKGLTEFDLNNGEQGPSFVSSIGTTMPTKPVMEISTSLTTAAGRTWPSSRASKCWTSMRGRTSRSMIASSM